jgi:hypothetical protein
MKRRNICKRVENKGNNAQDAGERHMHVSEEGKIIIFRGGNGIGGGGDVDPCCCIFIL